MSMECDSCLFVTWTHERICKLSAEFPLLLELVIGSPVGPQM